MVVEHHLRACGLLLLRIPGTGKCAFTLALGNEFSRRTLTLAEGNLMGSLVGETDRNIRRALRIADAMAPSRQAEPFSYSSEIL